VSPQVEDLLEAVESFSRLAEPSPGEVALDEPRFEVLRVLGQELVTEVLGEAPTALLECPRDLLTEGGDQDRLLLSPRIPTDLPKKCCNHFRCHGNPLGCSVKA